MAFNRMSCELGVLLAKSASLKNVFVRKNEYAFRTHFAYKIRCSNSNINCKAEMDD